MLFEFVRTFANVVIVRKVKKLFHCVRIVRIESAKLDLDVLNLTPRQNALALASRDVECPTIFGGDDSKAIGVAVEVGASSVSDFDF